MLHPKLLKWAFTFRALCKHLLMVSLALLFLSIAALWYRNHVGVDITEDDLVGIAFHWMAYGAFYAIAFISLPAFLALLMLYFFFKFRGIDLKISIHLWLAGFHFVLVLWHLLPLLH